MFARVVRTTRAPERGDAMREEIQKRALPALRGMPGFQRAYWLGDAESGRGMVITVWDSKESVEASEEATTRLREQMTQAQGITIESVEVYEMFAEG
jgi:heme-degrading monooxygenase HmoA